ncbi:DUF2961 domain-containing protein, partial [candidate division KSB1 bacterium]
MKRNYIIISVCILFLFASPVFSQHVGIGFYKNLSDLPYLYPNVESYYISSYDRTGGNNDGFTGKYSELYEDDNGEHVIFDAESSGCIYNMWGTGPNKIPNWGIMRFYFDNEKKPRLEIESGDFFSGMHEPFVFPLVNNQYVSSGGFSSCAVFPFAKRLKITTVEKPYFYNIYYQLYKDMKVKSWKPGYDYSELIDLFNKCGSDPVAARPDSINRNNFSLAKKVHRKDPDLKVLLDHKGGGVIRYIKMNPLYKPDMYNLNHIFLKITFDDMAEPSVNVPIGPFFGSGLGEADMRSLFTGMSSSGAYYCYLPMPFKSSVKIEIENRGHDSGGSFFTEIGYDVSLLKEKKGAQIGYFGAEYRREFPVVSENDYKLFDFKGTGAVIGQIMTVEPVKPDIKQWWEGDMRIYIN